MSLEPSADRRQYPRRTPEAKELLARVRLRGGRELEVKNISAGGALLEGESRLLPGTHVDLHVTTRQGRVLVRARILRASVFRLTADSVGYRIALLFEATVDTAVPRSFGQVVGERNPSSST
jgi:PilZ domain-containing protein